MQHFPAKFCLDFLIVDYLLEDLWSYWYFYAGGEFASLIYDLETEEHKVMFEFVSNDGT